MCDTTWQPIETAPVGKRIIVCVPIVNHRLVLAMKNDFGLWLDERMQPMWLPPMWWMPEPNKPEGLDKSAKLQEAS